MLFFSDGVFAIAITLLAIELHPPHDWDGQFISLVNAMAGKLIFFAVSFIVSGLFWSAHRMVFRHIVKFNELAAFINLLVLMLICLTPFVNSLLGAGHLSIDSIAIYIGLMIAISVLLGLLWGYATFIAKITDPRLSVAFKWYALARLSLYPPILSGASLWLAYNYGIWPSLAFLVPAAFISTRHSAKVFKADPAPASDPAGQPKA